MISKVIFTFFAALLLHCFATAQVPSKPQNADEEHAWRLYNQYKESKKKEAAIRSGISFTSGDIKTVNVGIVPLGVDPADVQRIAKLRKQLTAEVERQKKLEAAWDKKFFGKYGNLTESSVEIYDPKTKTKMDKIRFRLMYFPYKADDDIGTEQVPTDRIVLSPGLYNCGGAVELSEISASSMRLRGWQTLTPKPPEDRGLYFHIGTARLLSDGVTWRATARDVGGYCCGNNVESEFRIVSPTSFQIIHWRMWPLTAASPGSNEGWQSGGLCTLVE